MGFRARKSIKIAPGVRMTVSPRGVSTRVGVRGAGVSLGTDGRVRSSVGVPGSGVHYTKTHGSLRGGGQATQRPQQVTAPTVKPGLMAPKWEKSLHKSLVVKQDFEALQGIGEAHPEARPHAATFTALGLAVPQKDYIRAKDLLAWVFHTGFEPAEDPFITKYLPGTALEISIADGITVELPLDRSLIGLTLAELHQQAGALDAAVDVVEQLDPTTVAAVSLAELYAEQGEWQDVIDLTEGVSNDDEPSMYLLTQRGIALRHLGYYGASRESFKEALRVRTRPTELKHRALLERGLTHLAEGKPAPARKDFDKVYAENSQYPGLKELLDGLT